MKKTILLLSLFLLAAKKPTPTPSQTPLPRCCVCYNGPHYGCGPGGGGNPWPSPPTYTCVNDFQDNCQQFCESIGCTHSQIGGGLFNECEVGCGVLPPQTPFAPPTFTPTHKGNKK